MERVRLWRNNRRRLIGVVEFDQANRRLLFHIDDAAERDHISEVFKKTGDVSWAWARFGEGEWQEHRAEPLTPQWFWFVVANILYPRGYQADFGVED